MKEETISVGKMQTILRIGGSGKPVLILHGWGSQSKKWERIGEFLVSKGFKVIIPDLPGFGKSQSLPLPGDLNDYRDFVAALVNQLRLEKFFLLGHSFGGAVALKYSLKFPENVEKLFLTSAACIRRSSFKKTLFKILARAMKPFSFLPFFSLARRIVYSRYGVKSDYPAYSGIMRESYLKIIKQDCTADFSLVHVPTVLIWGSGDQITPLKQGQEMNRKIPGSVMEIIPGANHDLAEKHHQALSDLILKHLNP